MSDLLPCPFCGGEARYQADHTTECRDSVWCGACDYGMFDPDDQGSVVTAWNRRAAIPARVVGVKPDDAAAIRHSFDGYGWQYIDAGSGFEWSSTVTFSDADVAKIEEAIAEYEASK